MASDTTRQLLKSFIISPPNLTDRIQLVRRDLPMSIDVSATFVRGKLHVHDRLHWQRIACHTPSTPSLLARHNMDLHQLKSQDA